MQNREAIIKGTAEALLEKMTYTSYTENEYCLSMFRLIPSNRNLLIGILQKVLTGEEYNKLRTLTHEPQKGDAGYCLPLPNRDWLMDDHFVVHYPFKKFMASLETVLTAAPAPNA